jgi:hypothetical protein
MFVLTSDIKVGDYKPFKPNAVSWKNSMEDYTNTALIKIPAMTMLQREGDLYEILQTGLQFEEGMKVEVYAGYDGNNALRFKGFVSQLNFKIPMEIECEGYSYQLKKKVGYTKSFRNTTVKKILADVIQGTDIVLSDAIPNIPLEKATFQNVDGTQVLEWLKEKCLLTVYFQNEVLYAGLMFGQEAPSVKFRLGWNTAKEDDLKFSKKEPTQVRISIENRDKTGKKNSEAAGSKSEQQKTLNTVVSDPKIKKQLAEQEKIKLESAGYGGSFTAFLIPQVVPAMGVDIEDSKYPERAGKYFVTSVSGEVSSSGGRQKIDIGPKLSWESENR